MLLLNERARPPGNSATLYDPKNCDFELKIECGRRFIAGASYGGLEMKTALMNVGVVG